MRNNMKKIKLNLNIINILLALVLAVGSIMLMVDLIKYSSISQTIFAMAFVLVILVNLFFIVLVLWSKTHHFIQVVTTFFLVVFLSIDAFGLAYVYRISSAVNNVIVDVNQDQYEDVTTSFVKYDNSSLNSVDQIVNKTIGLIDDETFQEGNILPKAEIEKLGVSVNFKYFENYNDLLLGLFNNEIDFASLPKDYYSMFIINDGYEEYLDKTESFYDFTTKVKVEYANTVQKDLTKEPFSILLMGNDGGRTDTLILATFNPKTMTATMTSIARDSYVPIACYKNQAKDKINHSRQIGIQCTIDTVSNFLGVDIDYFLEVNFTAVVDIVDALGGLWLESPVEFVGQDSSSIRGSFTVWVGEGWQTMDGQQTLAFARERKNMPGGDLQRQLNQQQIITSMIRKLLETKDVNQLLNVLEAAGSNIKTNIGLSQMTNLANYMIGEMNNNAINSYYLLQIKNTRITGYFSWMYNESLQLPLSIYKPYEGSVKDAVTIINENLDVNYIPSANKNFSFTIALPYIAPNYIKDVYDEREVHEPLPDFMPSMISTNDIWTLDRVNSWSTSRNWINLSVKEIWPSDPGYSASYAYNQVVAQSVKYGVKTSNISNLNISIIKHELDCSIEVNRIDAQCRYIVPDFFGWNISDVIAWQNTNNYSVNIVKIESTDANYDRAKINIITGQSEKAYTKINTLNGRAIVVYTMDYPYIMVPQNQIVNIEKWSKLKVVEWHKLNMYTEPIFIYETTYSTNPEDQVTQIILDNQPLIQDISIKANLKLTYVLSIGPEPITPTPSPTTPTDPEVTTP